MIIDDEPFCVLGVRGLLKEWGIHVDNAVDVAFNGEEALKSVRRAKQLGVHYFLVFTDINMPIMDGLQVTRAIRKEYRKAEDDTIIVGITGHMDQKFIEEAKLAGMN